MVRTNCPHGFYSDQCVTCVQAWTDAEANAQKQAQKERNRGVEGNIVGSISILAEAQKVIYGDREKTYGSPDKNLQVIADLWNGYLGRAEIVGSMHRAISVNDVCVMMILLKAARLKNDPNHRDSQVDICGYAALMERVQEYRKQDERNRNQNVSSAPSLQYPGDSVNV